MLGLVVVVVLGATLLLGGVLARRLRIAPPVVLLVAGTSLGFVPVLRAVRLPPEVVLQLFLPALLFWESMSTSLREIRSNLRGIILNSTVLVMLTAAGVAVAAHLLGVPWGPAWVLGAALAPTDATAVGVLGNLLPRRSLTVLRAESLVNDGTALVVFGLAVGVTGGQEQLGPLSVGGLFLLTYVGGAAAGLLVAEVAERLRHRMDDPLQENLLSVLAPFATYLLAEATGVSGVLAVVVYGLRRSQAAPRQVHADARQLGEGFWRLVTYVLNGALFVLVGLQLQVAVRGLTSVDLTRGGIAVAVVAVAVIAIRFAWLFTIPYLIRVVDRRPGQRLRRVGARGRVVSAMAGFRGGVSLAAALAVPEVVASGAPFPDRDLIVFVTAGVIVVTLAQALVLPAVIGWARLPPDTSVDDERGLAEIVTTEEALAAIPQLAADLGTDPEIVDGLCREYSDRLDVLRADADGAEGGTARRHDQQDKALRLAALGQRRTTLLRLRDERRIDDTVLRQVQSDLDVEEVRLSRRELGE